MNEEVLSPTNERYNLRCRVEVKNMKFRDTQSFGKEWNSEADVVLLVPDSGIETDLFYSAWLPDMEGKDNFSEIGFLMGWPVNGFTRAALYRANSLFPHPHIYVMTKRTEDLLKQKRGEFIDIRVLKESEMEEYADGHAETNSPYEGLEGDMILRK